MRIVGLGWAGLAGAMALAVFAGCSGSDKDDAADGSAGGEGGESGETSAAGAAGRDAGAGGAKSSGGDGGSDGGEGGAQNGAGGQAGDGAGSGNHPPEPPVITAPALDGQVVAGSDVHMATELMQDGDGDEHVCSDFEIWSVTPRERVWVTSCIGGLEKVHTHFGDGTFEGPFAGMTELAADTDFELRVRHRDSSGDPETEWSDYAYREFRTATAASALPDAPGWVAMQPGFKVEQVVGGFQLPVNIAFVPNAPLAANEPLFYVTELYGTIKVVTTDGSVSVYRGGLVDFTPTGLFPGTGEQGLSGIVVDPATGDVFAGMLYDGGSGLHFPLVLRFTSSDGGFTADSSAVVLDMPGESQGQSHFISNLSIGPDAKLYVHMGDGFTTATALNLESFRGKFLRMNLDGSPASDNPFYDDTAVTARDYVWVYGVRNPFGGVWRQSDGSHFWVENGEAVDRFGRATAGTSYGWNGSDASMANGAIYNWSPAAAPVNVAFVEAGVFGGSGFPAEKFGHAFISESGPTWAAGVQQFGKRIVEVALDESDARIGDPATLVQYNGSGRSTVVGLAAGPDGLYFTTLYDDTSPVPTAAGASVYRVFYAGESGLGLRGEYFANADLTGPSVVRVDPTIAFNWFQRAPVPGMDAESFSVRWTGNLHPEFTETYVFTVQADDGVRLWVNDVLLVDQWLAGPVTSSGSVALTAEVDASIRVEYFDSLSNANILLRWSSPSQPLQVIPTERLEPPH